MVRPASQEHIEYLAQHPPNCLVNFVVQSASLVGVVFDGHGASGIYPDGLLENPNIVFKIHCKCGGSIYGIVAEARFDEISSYRDQVIAEIYMLRCLACGEQNPLFDIWAHGYNRETELLDGDTIDNYLGEIQLEDHTGERVTYQCFDCKTTSFEVFARFEYNSDLFNYPDFADREQDFFSWFTAKAKCMECTRLNTPIDVECA